MSATAGTVRLASATGRGVLIATVLATGIAFLDSTVVNVALPTIGRELDANLAGLQWTITGYTLTLAALILLGGSLGDRYGRRRILVIGTVWFAVASALCGIALNIEFLIAARLLQGVGGALLTPGSLALIQATYHPDDRAKAIGAWSGLGGVATAIGPFLGGWLVDAVSWRLVFLINLPLAALVIVFAFRFVPESRDDRVQHFDLTGAVLGALGLAGLTYALVEAPDAGASPLVVGAAVGGVIGLTAFIVVERRRRDPMLPPDLFRSVTFSAVNVVTFMIYAALGGILFFVVLQLQTVSGYSALAAGISLLPFTAMMLLLSAQSGSLAQRFGPRTQLICGPVIAGLGTLLMLRIGPHASYLVDVLPAVLVLALGITAVVAPLTSTVLAAAEVRHAGVASGVNNAVARAAGLIAVAALPLVAGLSGAAYRQPAQFGHGFRIAMVCCAGLFFLGGLLAAILVRHPEPFAPKSVPSRRITCDVCGPPIEAGRPAEAGTAPRG
ncbi:MAG: MFS transporter [Actinocatenispora sp.]